MTINWFLPRMALVCVFVPVAALAFFESVYLRDQVAMFEADAAGGASRVIKIWMWAFRGFAALMSVSCVAVFVRM